MFGDTEAKYRYIQELVIRARLRQQPVLLGTSSVQESENLHDHMRALCVLSSSLPVCTGCCACCGSVLSVCVCK